MKKILTIVSIFFSTICLAQNITSVEYFFDTDPGFGNGTNLTVTPNADIANLNFNADITSLGTGVHQLYVRSQDANGIWSVTNRTFFYKLSNIANTISNIVNIEYFFDTDPGFGNGNNIAVTPNTDIANLNINADITSLGTGVHQLYVRSQDANGIWSVTNRTFFYKLSNVVNTISNIVSIEYFFDTDPSFGNGNNIAVTPNTDIANLNINPDLTSILPGTHQLFVRSLDANGNWSVTNHQEVKILIPIQLTLFLQGYYAGNYTMTNVLQNEGVENTPTNHVDSITVELHESVYPYTLITSHKGILEDDGTFSAGYEISSQNNYCYIAVKHRNSIETWSANPVLMTTNTNYDFSDAQNKALGSNQIEVEPGVWALYSGDVNQDGTIDIFDFLTWDADNQAFASGYFASDLNGDGNVDIFDFLIWDPNNQNFIGILTP